MTTSAQKKSRTESSDGLLEALPVDRLKDEVVDLGRAVVSNGFSKIGDGVDSLTDKLNLLSGVTDAPEAIGKAAKKVSPAGPVKSAASKIKDAVTPNGGSSKSGSKNGGDSKDGTKDLKVTNIVESVDVPVSREVAYQQWTQFEEFPTFMKKVENVTQEKDEVVTWQAQIFWSHRTWKAKIVDQVPPERIVWKSQADKGRVDGAVTFHELAPDLTRVLVTLEYHPKGLFEHTGNLWRAQGRRVRLELKHFRRYVATSTLLHQDEVDGWEGEIHDGKPQKSKSSSSRSTKKSASSGSTRKSTSGSTAKKSTSSRTAKKSTSSSSSPAKKSSSSSSSPAKKSSSSSSSPAKKSSSSRTTKKSTSSRTAKKTSSSRARKTTSGTTRKSTTSRPRKTAASASSSRSGTSKKRASSGKG